MLRDWMKSKAAQDPHYPPIPFMSVDVPLWNIDMQRLYITERCELHSLAEATSEAPMCSPEERWERPTTWAVIKKGNKRAARVLESEQAAKDWIDLAGETNAKYEIELRPGESIRCKDYCLVREVCQFNPYKVLL